MLYFATTWFDLVGSLALIFVLSMAYGHIQRLFLSRYYAEILMGVAFGGVAWLQMNMPLEPMDGLIIDLRNVPLALCAAFLGWRASLICFLIAAGTRFHIGGIGLPSAILAMLIVWAVAALWEKVTRSFPERRLHHMFLLSLLISAHLNAAWILPEEARNWFLTNASLLFTILNAISITLGGYLLNVEEQRIAKEGRIAASIMYDPDHGAWTKPAFEREVKLRVNAGTMQTPAGLLVVRIRHANFLFSMVPNFWHDKVLGLLHMRLKDTFENADLAFSMGASALAIPLNADQFLRKGELEDSVKRLMEKDKFEFSADVKKLIAVDSEAFEWSVEQSLDDVIESAKSSFLALRTTPQKAMLRREDHTSLAKKRSAGKQNVFNSFPRTNNEVLFGKAAFLMKLNEAG
jgi:hypothetical protein